MADTLDHIDTLIRELLLDHKEGLSGTKSYKDVDRLLIEQCSVERGKISLKDSKNVDSDSMQNPSDVDATYRKKRGEEYRGYSVHSVETCDQENKLR